MPLSLILASSSPRRKELLTQLGIPFEISVPEVDEHCALPGPDAVRALSRRKAEAAARMNPGRYVLAADTLVCIHGQTLGKPRDPEDAKRMLRLLSGNTHQVYTGVTVISPEGTLLTDVDHSDVTFALMDDRMIEDYVATGEPLDKAGAYGIQGRASLFVSRLEGSYSGVMGLPLALVRQLLDRIGYPLYSA